MDERVAQYLRLSSCLFQSTVRRSGGDDDDDEDDDNINEERCTRHLELCRETPRTKLLIYDFYHSRHGATEFFQNI